MSASDKSSEGLTLYIYKYLQGRVIGQAELLVAVPFVHELCNDEELEETGRC